MRGWHARLVGRTDKCKNIATGVHKLLNLCTMQMLEKPLSLIGTSPLVLILDKAYVSHSLHHDVVLARVYITFYKRG